MSGGKSIMALTEALYSQLDRVMQADGDDALKMEVTRSKAIQGLASSINEANRQQLEVIKLRSTLSDQTDLYASKRMLGDGNGAQA